jgi:hypothetical protein
LNFILNFTGKNNSKRQNFEFYLKLPRYSYKSANIDSIIHVSQITVLI